MTTIKRFDELADGQSFAPVGFGHRTLMNHITKPFGNQCATNEDMQLVLLPDEMPCYAFDARPPQEPDHA